MAQAIFKLTAIPVEYISQRLADDIRLKMKTNAPSLDIKRDLQGIASDLKWSAVELRRVAERLSLAGNEADAQALLRMCTVLRADEDRLTGFSDGRTA